MYCVSRKVVLWSKCFDILWTLLKGFIKWGFINKLLTHFEDVLFSLLLSLFEFWSSLLNWWRNMEKKYANLWQIQSDSRSQTKPPMQTKSDGGARSAPPPLYFVTSCLIWLLEPLWICHKLVYLFCIFLLQLNNKFQNSTNSGKTQNNSK